MRVGSLLCDLLVFYRDKAADLYKGSTAPPPYMEPLAALVRHLPVISAR